MASINIRDLLTAFSPSLDYFAISSGDGRVKIWDTLKGQVQTEFADISSTDVSLTKTERGHLSVDYTCMKWLSLDRKKKRKLGSSLLVLGTGSGDVLALDVSAGQPKWIVSDCHPGGVSSISFSASESSIYTAGADGMICKIDPQTGNVSGKFKAQTKGISSMCVSPDGKTFATAGSKLKTFNCSNHQKIQKFSGHPGAVRCMIFTDDGKFILSSATNERYVALWKTGSGKKQSAHCVLAMEHPAVFLHAKCVESVGGDAGLFILAISETGVCYTWCGQSVEELQSAKPTKVSLSYDDAFLKNQKGALPTIFAAQLQVIPKPTSANVYLAYGLLVKPSFQKIFVEAGKDVELNSSQDGVLFPLSQSVKPQKGIDLRATVTALDRANVEDALLPVPKIADFSDKKTRDKQLLNCSVTLANVILSFADDMVDVETPTTSMELSLRQLRILPSDADLVKPVIDSLTNVGIHLQDNVRQKKIRASVMSMEPSNAHKLLETLVSVWQSRSQNANSVLPWISWILVIHGRYIVAQEKPESQMLNSLLKITKSREVAVQTLLQLSGRLQLVTAQFDKGSLVNNQPPSPDVQLEDEDEDDDVDERIYGEEDDQSDLSSDDK
ncbi:WD repeat-containing protein 43 [Linum perenne]